MNEEKQLPSSASGKVIKDGETYNHAEYGHVEVTGIWRQTQRLNTVQNTDTQDMIVVRFVPGEDGEWTDECLVSTIYLQKGHGDGMWYETCVFPVEGEGRESTVVDRYQAKDKADHGHEQTVRQLKEGEFML